MNMTSILSILVTLAMLFSGGIYSEDPNVQSSMITTISDAVVTLNGTEYPLTPSLVFGATTENGAALLDFHMPYGDETLFPVQAKIDDSGISLMLGSSSTAYTFTADLISEALQLDEMEGMDELLASYQQMLSASASMQDSWLSDEGIAERQAAFLEMLGDPETEDATFTLNGEEMSGQHWTATLDHEQCCAFMDMVLNSGDGALGKYCFTYLNTMLSMSGEDAEFNSYADLCDYGNMKVAMDIDFTGNETSGIYDMTIRFTVGSGDDAQTFNIPIQEIVYDQDTAEIHVSVDLSEMVGEAITLTCDMSADGDDTAFQFLMSDEESSVGMDMNVLTAEDGAYTETLSMNVNAPEDNLTLTVNLNADIAADQSGKTRVDIAATEDDTEYGLAFNVTTSRESVEDRISGAAQQTISSEEELDNATGLMMAVMGMAGDVEKLMNDEGIQALVTAADELFPSSYEEYGYDETYDGQSYSSDDPADLSFTLPQFTYLPEGYALSETSVNAQYDNAYLYFEYTGEDTNYHSMLHVDLYGADDSNTTIYSLDGSQALSGSSVSIERSDNDAVYATCTLNNVQIRLSYYDDDLSDEEIVKIFSGITFEVAETDAEAPADGAEDIQAPSEDKDAQ